jgi:hypothetical protein
MTTATPDKVEPRVSPILFGGTILISAFLLFELQPLIAKLILPWFGGSAAVWTACLLFFQVTLLGGYAYAHWLSGQPHRRKSIIHTALLAVSLFSLPILPSIRWKPTGVQDPLLGITGLLAVTVGLPYLLLSSTSPLLQSWYTRASGALPWRFFALSNAGSLAGLLAYPVLIEPFVTNRYQAWSWSIGYGTFAILCGAVAFALRGSVAGSPRVPIPATARPTLSACLIWIGLAACASALLLAVTAYLTQNIAAIPFLWVLPLSLYLLSFILCFDSSRWYRRPLFVCLGAAALLAIAANLSGEIVLFDIRVRIGVIGTAAFILFMVCHGELALRRPGPARLTSFYLMISAGGAIGGLLIAVVAPNVFNALYDFPLVVALMTFLFVYLIWLERREFPVAPFLNRPYDRGVVTILALLLAAWLVLRMAASQVFSFTEFFEPGHDVRILALGAVLVLYLMWRAQGSGRTRFAVVAAAAVFALGLAGLLARDTLAPLRDARLLSRNFYGALRVADSEPEGSTKGPVRYLYNGTILHGAQALTPAYRRVPLTYYRAKSGVGLALISLMKHGPLHVGVIGLGAGTLAAYGRPVDRYRFYDINPLVLKIATTEFTFLNDCRAPHDVVLGDARLSLEQEPPQQFDLLAVDAFSGDAIPVHLLTREAFRLYWRHLKTDGILAVHVTNQYLLLAPVVLTGAFEGLRDARMVTDNSLVDAISEWVLVTSRDGFFNQPEIRSAAKLIDPIPGFRMWTDDDSNLFKIQR